MRGVWILRDGCWPQLGVPDDDLTILTPPTRSVAVRWGGQGDHPKVVSAPEMRARPEGLAAARRLVRCRVTAA